MRDISFLFDLAFRKTPPPTQPKVHTLPDMLGIDGKVVTAKDLKGMIR